MSRASNLDHPYAVLGVSRTATDDEIKKAYKKAALQNHPDKCKPEDKASAEVKFRMISEAYEILKDPVLRQRFDAYGMDGIKGGGVSASSRSNGFQQGFPSGFAFHDPRSLFEEFFGDSDPFAHSFFSNTPGFGADPFHQQIHRNMHQSSPFGNHPFFSSFPGMTNVMSNAGVPAAGFSSFSSSSNSFGGGRGNFASQSTQTQIVNGERTTVTTTTDGNGTRTETVVVGRDGREKKREVVENGRVTLSVESGRADNRGLLDRGKF
ncbi:DnaJ domain-containing protein [Chytriomyces sp. MP71]|nr:DnaJ domain-containing protein [Chytriomyces sp. MP71]